MSTTDSDLHSLKASSLNPQTQIPADILNPDILQFSSTEDIRTQQGTDSLANQMINNAEKISVTVRENLNPDFTPIEVGGIKFTPVESLKNIALPQPHEISEDIIEKKFVHKINTQNVVISHPTRLSEDVFRARVMTPLKNDFFFDHSYDHAPGMLLIEAFRQLGTAISHLYFNVPFDYVFILYDMHTKFEKYTLLDEPIYIDFTILDKKIKAGIARKLNGQGLVKQGNAITCEFVSSWAMLPKALVAKIK